MWFIVGMVYMHFGNVQPEIFVYNTIFKDKKTCQTKYQNAPEAFMDDMFARRPELKSMSFSCVDKQLLDELRISNKIKKL